MICDLKIELSTANFFSQFFQSRYVTKSQSQKSLLKNEGLIEN